MTKLDDTVLRQRVGAELDCDPSVDASAIGVAVKDGVVTLTGSVGSYPQKENAERAAKRVSGVRAVAEELQVRLPRASVKSDAEIAQSALATLKACEAAVPGQCIQITVEDGWITLDGDVERSSIKTAAQNAVEHAPGVKGVINQLVVTPRADVSEVKAKIESALVRRAASDAERIHVEAVDDTVVLRGSVHSWQAKVDAEQAAWSAPGVADVRDDLTIMPTLRFADVEQDCESR
jgi:osmotically-inducible protein OsmY